MKTLRQSVSWWCFNGKLAPEALVRACADIGYAAMELVEEPNWALVKDHGLGIATIRGHASLTNGLNRRENHAGIEAEIRASLEQAVKWGVPNLVCFSGNRNGLDDATGAAITAEGLHRVAQHAEAAGVTLVLELLNSKVDHPDYQCDKTAWGVKVVQQVNSPRVKLLYDIYHMQIMEGDVIRTIRENHPHIAHYHTAGVPGRNEIDESQELYYPAIARAILETGYDGYLGQEFIPTGDPVAGLRRAFDLCNVRIA
ncbi:MAG: TIM barrel protein [Anaerolineae bacterium]|nr:TIM barrel protein [Anaerolineae bacterium]